MKRLSSKNVTIREVAKEVGVSIATVSRYLNGKQRVSLEMSSKIDQAIEKLGYRPNAVARSLKNSLSKCLGLLLPNIENPFFPALVRGVEDGAHEAGYALFLCNTDGQWEKEKHYLDFLAQKMVDGLLIVPGTQSTEWVEMLQQLLIPTVLIDRKLKGATCPFIGVDQEQGAFAVVSHLIQQGCRRIGCIQGRPGLSTSDERLNGYISALTKQGLPILSELILPGDFSFDSGYSGAAQLLDLKVDAIFAANDMMALGCLEYAKSQSISVPEQLALAGFDDIRLSQWCQPDLTTVRQPAYELGRQAFAIWQELWQGQDVSQQTIFSAELVVRSSSLYKNNKGD